MLSGRVFWRFRIPMRLRVGERPAGVVVVDLEVAVVERRERDFGVSVERVVVGVNVLVAMGDLVRTKAGLLGVASLLRPLERLEKRVGSMFSVSTSS